VQSFDSSGVTTFLGTPVSILTEDSATPTWRLGTVVGAGAEARLWDSNWSARLEYLHYEFGKSSTFTASNGESSSSGNLTADVVRAGLDYKLGLGGGLGSSGAGAIATPFKATPAALWSWSGFYVGGHAGYGWGRDPFYEPGMGDSGNVTVGGFDSRGVIGGFQAGANWQKGTWVGGLELDLSGTGVKGSSTSTAALTGGPPGTDTITSQDSFELLASGRARLGYLVRPDIMLYGTAGLAWTHLTQSSDETEIAGGVTTLTTSNTNVGWRLGWVAGAGGEFRLGSSSWLARVEYLHYDFGDSGNGFDTTVPGFVTLASSDISIDAVRGGLSYKFEEDRSTAGSTRVAMPVKAMRLKAPPARSWSGFYVGGHAGYGWSRDPVTETTVLTGSGLFTFSNDPIGQSSIPSRGYLAGFQAGANWQLGDLVAGLEFDLSTTDIRGATTDVSLLGDETVTHTDRFNLLGSARSRIGFLPWPNVLLYGTGGLAWTRLNQFDLDALSGNGVNGGWSPTWRVGWVAGAGTETRLWDSDWLMRVEYLHYDFADAGSSAETEIEVGSGSGVQTVTTGHLTTDLVRTALSLKLN